MIHGYVLQFQETHQRPKSDGGWTEVRQRLEGGRSDIRDSKRVQRAEVIECNKEVETQ